MDDKDLRLECFKYLEPRYVKLSTAFRAAELLFRFIDGERGDLISDQISGTRE